LTFASCVLEDLSPGGARCKIAAPLSEEPLEANLPIQLKFVLPGHDDQIIVIARIAHVIASDTLGLAFLQITERHADQVVQWYLELLRSHKASEAGNPADRKGDRRFG
jgi:c-di-GMP-binding flagellar brake protein YcgR